MTRVHHDNGCPPKIAIYTKQFGCDIYTQMFSLTFRCSVWWNRPEGGSDMSKNAQEESLPFQSFCRSRNHDNMAKNKPTVCMTSAILPWSMWYLSDVTCRLAPHYKRWFIKSDRKWKGRQRREDDNSVIYIPQGQISSSICNCLGWNRWPLHPLSQTLKNVCTYASSEHF